ncbi:MAG: CPBP family intramembrane metalloprotease [Candidatus Krumholzibacteria bacterium]|nr:CPBP family intramembrane metalloprotease [Candidatus Krumholzibacteria bacterium]
MQTSALDPYALITLLIMMVILPLVGVWDFQRLLRWMDEGRSDARTKTYTWILFMEWGLVLGLGGWWFAAGRGLEPLGLVPVASGWQWLALGLGLAATAFMVWQMFAVLGSSEQLGQAREQMGSLGGLAPRNPGEDRQFVLVSITAGVCEEFLYRGVLMAVLTSVVGLWPAVGLSSVIFGLGHAYQGVAGIGKTALVGLAMALLTVFSGSLFVAMVLHAVVDLTSGRIMAAALRTAPQADDLEIQAT